MKTEIIIGQAERIEESAIDAVRLAVKKFSPKSQVVHIIIASIIKTHKGWRTLVKVIADPDLDSIAQDAITFCHLPHIYNDLYDELIDEVDNINLISDDSIWDNIAAYLLDIIFYKAVHFKPLEKIKGSNGGYLKESHKNDNQQPEIDTLGIDFDSDKLKEPHQTNKLQSQSFYKTVNSENAKSLKDESEYYLDKVGDLTRHEQLIKILKHNFN